MPAILHWPGRIATATSDHLASTLDLLPTIVKLSGGRLPQDGVVRDGVSMASWLARPTTTPSLRKSVIFYPQLAQRSRGLYAVRCGLWKVHWKQQGSMQCVGVRDAVCGPETPYSVLPTPVAYDLGVDPGENWPLNASDASSGYKQAIEMCTAARDEHLQTMVWDADGPQLAWAVGGGWDLQLQPCARPGCSPFPACCVKELSLELKTDDKFESKEEHATAPPPAGGGRCPRCCRAEQYSIAF